MSAPLICGAAAAIYCQEPSLSPASVIAQILECAEDNPQLADKVQDGKVFNISNCLVPVETFATSNPFFPIPFGKESLLVVAFSCGWGNSTVLLR